MMNEHGKSDNCIVPEKSPNKASSEAAEVMEERRLVKGNLFEQNMLRTQGRVRVQSALGRIRKAAEKVVNQKLTALYHHVYNGDVLRECYYAVKRTAVPGVDGVTWRCYGEKLEENLTSLSGRLKRGAYRALPVKRSYVPKIDGHRRPIGVLALEDKIVQRAAVMVLNSIYEPDFVDFSYGFRPGRNPHNTLDALYAGITKRKVNWVLDADIREFFDTLSHDWLVEFVQHRIADKRIWRLIRKWLKAGVLEEGIRTQAEIGAVQGGSISPLLANIYLHYVFDLWAQRWRSRQTHGDVIIVRYADDFIVGFQYRNEAERFLAELKERFAQFGLVLHRDKTRLIEFGRFAIQNRTKRGVGKPETFNFLGFTHICGQQGMDGLRYAVKQLAKSFD